MNLPHRVSFVACGLALLIAVPAAAQVDVNSVSSSSGSSVSYESGRSAGKRIGFIGPASSGRPGIFFFNKAVKAFKKKQYAFAIDMYKVSASWAYKPAEYNLAVIYSRGVGVPVDLPRAMAWIALAAERGDSHYVDARYAINVELDSEEVVEANRILEQLKPEYADKKAMRQAKRRWRDAKSSATGSKLGSTGNLKVGKAGNTAATYSFYATMTNAFELTSGSHTDGSREYRQVRESDSPYEQKDRVQAGTVTVDKLIIPDLSKAKTPVSVPAEDSRHR